MTFIERIKQFFEVDPLPPPLPAVADFLEYYELPFELRFFQKEVIDVLANFQGSGCYMDVGTGKTVVATVLALYHALHNRIDRVLVVMPPILIEQWAEWLENFPVSVTAYKGTPAQRRGLSLKSDFVLMSFDIFKRDFSRITEEFKGVPTYVIVDEASKIRRHQTLAYKAVREFLQMPEETRFFVLLSGTPINSPVHCYAYASLTSPETYKNFGRFTLIHVRSSNQFGEPRAFKELGLLKTVLYHNSIQVEAADVLDLPEVSYVKSDYSLSKKHKALYDQLVEEKLLEIEGGVIDGTTAQRLYQATQQIILSPPLADGEKPTVPEGFSVLDSMLEEAGLALNSGEKLIVYCHYKVSNAAITEYIKKNHGKYATPIQAYGAMAPKQNTSNIKRFLHDPSANVLVANPRSVGIGLNLQLVCRLILFLELPLTADDFKQAVGRIKREGQTRPCLIRFAVAEDTIQESLARSITRKEDLAQKVFPTKETLRAALFGE